MHRNLARTFSLLVLLVSSAALAAADDVFSEAAKNALIADFPQRDKLPQTTTPKSAWYASRMEGSWGPHAVTYPAVTPPPDSDLVAWKRARIIAVANHYLGLPYQHHHIPGWEPPKTWTSKLGVPESA